MWSYPRCASAVYQQDSKAFPIKSAETWLQKSVPSNISLIIWFHDLLCWFRDFNRMLHWLGFKCDINLIVAYSSSRSWENWGKSALQSGSWSTGKLGKSMLSVTTRLGHSDHTIKMAVTSRVCPAALSFGKRGITLATSKSPVGWEKGWPPSHPPLVATSGLGKCHKGLCQRGTGCTVGLAKGFHWLHSGLLEEAAGKGKQLHPFMSEVCNKLDLVLSLHPWK